MWAEKKLEAKHGVYYQLRAMSDRICKEHGLSVVKNPQKHKTARSVYSAEKNVEPTRFNLIREAMDKAMTMAFSWNELSTVLRKMGYVFESDPYHKYATIRSIGSKKGVRTFRLGEEERYESTVRNLTIRQI